jgi:hypothetical protein
LNRAVHEFGCDGPSSVTKAPMRVHACVCMCVRAH